jgi:hypothetical protein
LGRVEELRKARVEDDEDGDAVGGGKGGENGDKLGVGWIYEGDMETLVCD